MKKRGFVSFLVHKKWRVVDFLEPLAALPFAFCIIYVIENGLGGFGLIMCMFLLFIYLPSVVVFFDRVVR